MRGMILAGGEGTRLRPLTCDLPKPMARLCGRPVLDYTLALLRRHGIEPVTMTLQYRPEVIVARYGAMAGVTCAVETVPLGTAGSVRQAWEGGEVAVISGDALTDADLTAAAAFHRARGAAVTMVVKRVSDPRGYGVVERDADGRVTAFAEKPERVSGDTAWVNTGIYMLSPAALERVPAGQTFDFARDLFPRLLAEGIPVYGWETAGYWCDMGTLSAYRQAQRDLLDGRVAGVTVPEPVLPGRVTAEGRVYVGEGVRWGDGVRLGSYAVVEEGSCIGAGASIGDAVIGRRAYVGEGATVQGAVVCHGAAVGRGAVVGEGAAIGAGSVAGEYATVCAGVRLWPGYKVEAHTVARVDRREMAADERVTAVRFTDGAITGETGVEVTPARCARIGAAIGSRYAEGRIAVGGSFDAASEALRRAVTAGLLSAGVNVWDAGDCVPTQFDHFVGAERLTAGVYVSGGSCARLRVVDRYGLPIGAAAERIIEEGAAADEPRRVSWDRWRRPVDVRALGQLYRQALMAVAPEGLRGVAVTVRGTDSHSVRLLREVCEALGCQPGGTLRLHLGGDGRLLSLYDRDVGYVWPWQVWALCARAECEEGHDPALPDDAPLMLDEVAAAYGRRVRRYDGGTGEEEAEARALAVSQAWARDGLWAAVKVLALLKAGGGSSAVLTAGLPDFTVASRTVMCEAEPTQVWRWLEERGDGERVGEDWRWRTAGGVCRVRPLRRGHAVRISAEAADAEIAEELCGQWEKEMNRF